MNLLMQSLIRESGEREIHQELFLWMVLDLNGQAHEPVGEVVRAEFGGTLRKVLCNRKAKESEATRPPCGA